jgi:hypothetical protein
MIWSSGGKHGLAIGLRFELLYELSVAEMQVMGSLQPIAAPYFPPDDTIMECRQMTVRVTVVDPEHEGV